VRSRKVVRGIEMEQSGCGHDPVDGGHSQLLQ